MFSVQLTTFDFCDVHLSNIKQCSELMIFLIYISAKLVLRVETCHVSVVCQFHVVLFTSVDELSGSPSTTGWKGNSFMTFYECFIKRYYGGVFRITTS